MNREQQHLTWVQGVVTDQNQEGMNFNKMCLEELLKATQHLAHAWHHDVIEGVHCHSGNNTSTEALLSNYLWVDFPICYYMEITNSFTFHYYPHLSCKMLCSS